MIKLKQLSKEQFQTGIDYSNQKFYKNHSMLQVFRNCNFSDTEFDECIFSYTQFIGCFLNKLTFVNCNLSGTKFYENSTNSTSVIHSDITATNLESLHIQNLIILNNCFKYPKFPEIETEKIYI